MNHREKAKYTISTRNVLIDESDLLINSSTDDAMLSSTNRAMIVRAT